MAVVDRSTGAQRYPLLWRVLHGVLAGAVVVLLAAGVGMTRLTLSFEATVALYQTHKFIGLGVAGLMLARVAVRVWWPAPPAPASISSTAQCLATAHHVTMYAILLALPPVGWLLVSAAPLTLPLTLFGWVEVPLSASMSGLPETARTAWYVNLKTVHTGLAYALGALIIGHVGAAFFHGRPILERMSLRRAKFVSQDATRNDIIAPSSPSVSDEVVPRAEAAHVQQPQQMDPAAIP